MSRALCLQCQRPIKACICAFTTKIDNQIPVVVLQHPSEVKQSKGTVRLLQQSLVNCQVIVGEDFGQCQELSKIIKRYGDNIALLYPSEQAREVDFLTPDIAEVNCSPEHEKNKRCNLECNISCIIILDGTWKKAYRMFMLNLQLHMMNHIVLPQGIPSLYQIRKTKKDNALSSLEACCHALARLENSPEKYQELLNNFVKFNEFQHSFNEQYR